MPPSSPPTIQSTAEVLDHDFKDAPSLLFREHFASVAKKCLEAAAVLKS